MATSRCKRCPMPRAQRHSPRVPIPRPIHSVAMPGAAGPHWPAQNVRRARSSQDARSLHRLVFVNAVGSSVSTPEADSYRPLITDPVSSSRLPCSLLLKA
jgi:hypothetical protein